MSASDAAFGAAAVDMLAAAVGEVDRSLPGWLEAIGGDEIAAVELLEDLRGLAARLAGVVAGVETHAARVMTRRQWSLPDGRIVTRSSGSRRVWDHRPVAFAVVAAVLDDMADPDTGEMVGDRDTAIRVADALLEAGAVAYWRNGPLDSWGISPDEFSRREPGRRTVRVSRPAGQGAAR